MPRFDIYLNPNRAASHTLFLDVQSDLVSLSTRWCIPLYHHTPPHPYLPGAQAVLEIADRDYVLDAPNILAVPRILLRRKVAHLSGNDRLTAAACIEFMLRGY
jgi:hypothetical protein